MKENNRKAIARRARQRKQRARRVALTLCLIVATMLVSVGGTIAWLTATSGTVTNTFTAGDIKITLQEHDYVPGTNGAVGTLDKSKEVAAEEQYKMVPGVILPKDPFVRVKATSEACYLFVEVVPKNDADTFLAYSVDDEWTKTDLKPKHEGGKVYVYAANVPYTGTDTEYYILSGNQVTVKEGITKAQLNALTEQQTYPQLEFYAYAVQQAKIDNYTDAWGKL